ncbi:MAG TPA: hypothetical protein VGE38_06780 [Nocardioides sp.]|uniref:hypothetical protein n=1 Tax=Nocardioides sp. TaxID=35761 RepID=UPI002EDB4931
MSEDLTPSETGTPGGTGVPEVDAVLAAVDDLDTLPVAEHVAVFERAQEQLRRALDAGS